MRRIESLKLELAEAIKESREYKEYVQLADYIKRQPDLKRQLDEFRRENFLYQYSDDVENSFDAAEQLNAKFLDVRVQKDVENFLSAEMCLCRMVQDICLSVVEAIDFDMDFLQ